MPKAKIPTYCYKNGQLRLIASSMSDASRFTRESLSVVNATVKGITRKSDNGWTFSAKELDEETLDKLKIDSIEDDDEDSLFVIPKSTENKKRELRMMFENECKHSPKHINEMKRKLFNELLFNI